jgi:hypothetical protein
MACVLIYCNVATGREILRLKDSTGHLPVPSVGEKIKLDGTHYKVESVSMSESLSRAILPSEYRVFLRLFTELTKVASV